MFELHAPSDEAEVLPPDDDNEPSPSEVYGSITVPQSMVWFRECAFGPGYMVSVGYMDQAIGQPISGGASFGYTLLFVIMLSNLMAILLQALAARLGIVTGRDLAQACRAYYPRPVNLLLWIACELAIIACDLAEVIGTAIALQLLFRIPLIAGALIAGLDAFLLLFLMNNGFRFLEAFIIALLIVIFGCFAVQIMAAQPSVGDLLRNLLIPSPEILTNPAMLYVAIGIIGATVMPHNLYLHSSIVQTRDYAKTPSGKRDAIKWATIDSTTALMLALFVNAAILIVAAVAFHDSGHEDVADIGQAFQLLSPLLGLGIASLLFAIALLASGVNSTVTATLAGQMSWKAFCACAFRIGRGG
jgi:manganese transport protein